MILKTSSINLKTSSANERVPEAVAQRCSVKKVFLENSVTLFKNRLWHKCFPELCEISKNMFS